MVYVLCKNKKGSFKDIAKFHKRNKKYNETSVDYIRVEDKEKLFEGHICLLGLKRRAK